jgi:fermentation-respiration switch protein FrsA (DUF1100 family)
MKLLIPLLTHICLILCLGIVSCAAQTQTPDQPEKKVEKKGSLLGLTAKMLMGKKGGDKLFYMPKKGKGRTPNQYGIAYEDVFFQSADKTKLHGWFLPAKKGVKKAKGTIVFSHGNFGKVSRHLGYVNGMIASGYNVFLYDYRGFGQSEGEAEKLGIISDVVAAFRYIKTRKDIDQDKIISASQSLGGAKSIAALAEFHPKGLRGIVVMNTFSSYRKMALKIAGNTANYVITDTCNPVDLVKQLPKVPLLVMHSENDQLIPCEHGEEIYNAANEPKTFMKLKAGGHNNFLVVNRHENEKKLLKWLDDLVK